MKVTIAIPSIPTRSKLLARAVASVEAQETQHDVGCSVHCDETREGAWGTRNTALAKALTGNPDWIGFLDDDDELMQHHVEFLLAAADAHEADIVWGWYTIPESPGYDPFRTEKRTQQLNVDKPHIVPIAYMAKASFLRAALDDDCGFQAEAGQGWLDQDWPILRHMLQHGATAHATGEFTWLWHHHGANTSGLPNQGR